VNNQTFADLVRAQTGFSGEGRLTEYLSRKNGELYFGDQLNLNALVERHGAPLEVVNTLHIADQIGRMQHAVAAARREAGYGGAFLYAYATKANFAAEAVRAALQAGANYETSATSDLQIAHGLWQDGVLPDDRLVLCNGSKDQGYRDAIRAFRLDGAANVIPVLDDLDELHDLIDVALPIRFGVRERAAGNRDGNHLGNDRFGLTSAEIAAAAARIAGSRHELVLYHAMVGSQIEDAATFLQLLQASVEQYCRLRRLVPSLRYFNFGGGIPTAGYRLDFHFDYQQFFTALFTTIRETCARFGVPQPAVIGEFGRYTVATHSTFLLEIGAVKAGRPGEADWYLLDGSLMTTLPDSLFVSGQQFVILPLTDWDRPLRSVRLAGRRTCDSDDLYPRPDQPPLLLPDTGRGLVVAMFGIGAYQQMISGRGGAHHCLNPEPARVILEQHGTTLHSRFVPQQDLSTIMQLLGYPAARPEPVAVPRPQLVSMASRRRLRERFAGGR
jgi:arginine decarboxylase